MKITQGKPGSGVSFIGCRVGQTAEEALREKEARKAEEKLMMAEIAAQKEKAAAPPGREEEKKVEEEEGKDALDLSKVAMIPIDRKLMNKEAQTALDGIKGFPPITDQLSGMWAGLKTQLTPQELHERVGTTAALYGQTTDVCYRTENANPWNPDNKFSYVNRLEMTKNLYDGAKTQVACTAFKLVQETEARQEAERRMNLELRKDKCRGEVEKAILAGVRHCSKQVLGEGDMNLAVYQYARAFLTTPGEPLDPVLKEELCQQLLGGNSETEEAEEMEFYGTFPQFIPRGVEWNIPDYEDSMAGKEIKGTKEVANVCVMRQVRHEAPQIKDPIRLGQMHRMATYYVQAVDSMILREDCHGEKKSPKEVRAMCIGMLLEALDDKPVTFNGLDPGRFEKYQAAMKEAKERKEKERKGKRSRTK